MVHNVAPIVGAVLDEESDDCSDFPLESIIAANGIFKLHFDLESGLNSKYWLMEANPEINWCLFYPAGTMVTNSVQHLSSQNQSGNL